jgi:hypothetical protein
MTMAILIVFPQRYIKLKCTLVSLYGEVVSKYIQKLSTTHTGIQQRTARMYVIFLFNEQPLQLYNNMTWDSRNKRISLH